MHSSLIGKIEKSKRYAQQPERVRVNALDLTFQGEHDQYHVTLRDDAWHCSCHFYEGFGTCAHVMAMQRIFDVMLTSEARNAPGMLATV